MCSPGQKQIHFAENISHPNDGGGDALLDGTERKRRAISFIFIYDYLRVCVCISLDPTGNNPTVNALPIENDSSHIRIRKHTPARAQKNQPYRSTELIVRLVGGRRRGKKQVTNTPWNRIADGGQRECRRRFRHIWALLSLIESNQISKYLKVIAALWTWISCGLRVVSRELMRIRQKHVCALSRRRTALWGVGGAHLNHSHDRISDNFNRLCQQIYSSDRKEEWGCGRRCACRMSYR